MKNNRTHDAKSCEICIRWDDRVRTLGMIIRAGGCPAQTHIDFLEELCSGPDAEHISTTVLNWALEHMQKKLQRLKAKEAKSHDQAVAV